MNSKADECNENSRSMIEEGVEGPSKGDCREVVMQLQGGGETSNKNKDYQVYILQLTRHIL